MIEYDFHGRSRRQELQRAGRIMHGDGNSYTIIMTRKELEKYGKRLYSLEEKGFEIEYKKY